jgi:hypothetical protein
LNAHIVSERSERKINEIPAFILSIDSEFHKLEVSIRSKLITTVDLIDVKIYEIPQPVRSAAKYVRCQRQSH